MGREDVVEDDIESWQGLPAVRPRVDGIDYGLAMLAEGWDEGASL